MILIINAFSISHSNSRIHDHHDTMMIGYYTRNRRNGSSSSVISQMRKIKRMLFLIFASTTTTRSYYNTNWIQFSSAFTVQYNNNTGRGLHYHRRRFYSASMILRAKPKRMGSVVDNYQTVSVNCNNCRLRLFRYKKKNGTKSNLIKCYIERICEDSAGILFQSKIKTKSSAASSEQHQQPQPKHQQQQRPYDDDVSIDPFESSSSSPWTCPNCGTNFARSSLIHGRPALKLIGGKVRMSKKK